MIQLNPFALLARLVVTAPKKSLQGPQTAVTAMARAAEAAVPSKPAKAEESNMATIGTIFVDVEHAVEVGAADVLKVLTKTTAELPKVTAAAPKVAASLAVLLGQVGTAVTDTSSAANAGGLNIVLDNATLAAVKEVWPDTKAFLATLGINV
ncbi:hypothetical protein GOB94_14010 [Granulicella sp. 5B5]|uniref:hypothetical protein n=1 Tax=Granulicella sp. 5B5 TaxID=1617967 RepID=UPI0015F602E0|nr:hypothetical protein [Granulicella sp. 5B5]QMV19680.1 hypothetical protein GOB94_14010 [Granulicella sp. 5B5]